MYTDIVRYPQEREQVFELFEKAHGLVYDGMSNIQRPKDLCQLCGTEYLEIEPQKLRLRRNNK